MPETPTRRAASSSVLLTTAYFPPVEYFAQLARYSVVYLEACEKYQKQSWRNRCRILTANGPMDLNFPIVHDGSTMIKDIKVDWSTPWLHKTEYAIDSAYYSSPFFEYYRDELFAILDSRPATLWEMNLRIIDFFCQKIGIKPEIRETEWYEAPAGACSRGESEDRRYTIHPKMASDYVARPYWQVFREKFGFVGGLSVMDLLFNEGPESLGYLL